VPVRRRPDPDDARHRLAVVDPDLQPHAHGGLARTQRQQVIADGEAARLRAWQPLEALRRRLVEVAPADGPDVAGYALAAPAEVIGRGDVGEEVEAELVAQMARGFGQARGIDDEGRLAFCFADLDQPGNAVEIQDATPCSS